jgi:hypothetical protein
MSTTKWTPEYSAWRHGGWIINNVRYPNGGYGCVSRNYFDHKWRIACDSRPSSYPGGTDDHTYANRDAAARAEYALVNGCGAQRDADGADS